MTFDESSGLPVVEHRTRDLSALLAEAEWGWSRKRSDAYVFEHYETPIDPAKKTAEHSATLHAEALKQAKEKGRIYPCTYSVEHARRDREEREGNREAQAIRSAEDAGLKVAPDQVYQSSCRRLGERE